MDDDVLDVNCGRCGRRLAMRIDDLRDLRTVECADCARIARHGATETPSSIDESHLLGGPRVLRSQRREPC